MSKVDEFRSDDPELIEALKRDEGVREKPYYDSVGKISIGVGRNLDDKGLRPDEIRFLLKNDIEEALADARKFSWFPRLDRPRQRVIVNMIFNLGAPRFRNFKKMLAALEKQDYIKASEEMLDSKWARQVGVRAQRLADIMRGNHG